MLHEEAFALFERHIWVYNDINKHMKQTCFLFHRHFKGIICFTNLAKFTCSDIREMRGIVFIANNKLEIHSFWPLMLIAKTTGILLRN